MLKDKPRANACMIRLLIKIAQAKRAKKQQKVNDRFENTVWDAGW